MFSFSNSLAVGLVLASSVVQAAPNELFQRGKCNNDNCLRAVSGTNVKQAATAAADCTSFYAQTITPCPATTTITYTSTVTDPSTVTVTAGPYKRDAIQEERAAQAELKARATSTCGEPTGLPTYAQDKCGSDPVRYSSACSCVGATPTPYATAPQPTVTVSTTVTTTQTPVATTYPCDPATFYVQADSGPYQGNYIYVNRQHGGMSASVNSIYQAAVLGLNKQGVLYVYGPGYFASPLYPRVQNAYGDGSYSASYVYASPQVPNDYFSRIVCAIDPSTNAFTCSDQKPVPENRFLTCPYGYSSFVLATQTYYDTRCVPITFKVIPVTCSA